MRVALVFLVGCAALGAAARANAADHLFVVTSYLHAIGGSAAIELVPPWNSTVGVEPVGHVPTVEHAFGLHYVVNASPQDNLQIIDPATFNTIQTISFEPASNPQSVLVLNDGTAFVSFYDRAELLRVDLVTGGTVGSVDLAPFADSDGLPEMDRMARDGNHVFVQLRRIDRSLEPEPPVKGGLAVVDISTNVLVDVDPVAPGTQVIELAWYDPRLPMQIEGRTLYVGEPGGFYDQAGGIEAVNLDTLQSAGLVYTEKQIGAAQMSGFLFVSPTRGYFIHHTDFTQSSHLVSFSRTTGTFIAEHYVTFGLTERLAYDPVTGFLYFPDAGEGWGIRVFEAATGSQLTTESIQTGFPPVDLVVARAGETAAEPRPLAPTRVTWASPNPTQGAVDSRRREGGFLAAHARRCDRRARPLHERRPRRIRCSLSLGWPE